MIHDDLADALVTFALFALAVILVLALGLYLT